MKAMLLAANMGSEEAMCCGDAAVAAELGTSMADARSGAVRGQGGRRGRGRE